MNYTYINIQPGRKADNQQVFLTFFSRLEHLLHQDDHRAFASVTLTCYRKYRLDRYRGIILLINGGFGMGNVRISDGEAQLMNEQVFHILEREDKHYSLGRSGSVLIIECPIEPGDSIYRIDIEENRMPFDGSPFFWHQLEASDETVN